MIRFSCEKCGKVYEVEEKYSGKSVKCKKCNTKLSIPSVENEPEKEQTKEYQILDEIYQDIPAPEDSNTQDTDPIYDLKKETKACPFCGEEILEVAKKCKHCGEFLPKVKPQDSMPQGAKSQSEHNLKKGFFYKLQNPQRKTSKVAWVLLYILIVIFILPWVFLVLDEFKVFCSEDEKRLIRAAKDLRIHNTSTSLESSLNRFSNELDKVRLRRSAKDKGYTVISDARALILSYEVSENESGSMSGGRAFWVGGLQGQKKSDLIEAINDFIDDI